MDPLFKFKCDLCNIRYEDKELGDRCSHCGGLLEYTYDQEYIKSINFKGRLSFWRYREAMPSVKHTVSLGEGGTPLWHAKKLTETLRLQNLALKNETRNPTNSFKDRTATLMISDAVTKGFDSIVCATNGNHGASLSAYSAKEDISCHLLVTSDLDIGKLAQIIAYDAHIEESGDSIDSAIHRANEISNDMGWYQATTELNPLSIEALKTISFEIAEQGEVPDWMAVAMGSGVTIHALWKGFNELSEMGIIKKKPRLIGVQSEGCSPIVEAYKKGEEKPIIPKEFETVATAIKVSNPLFGTAALNDLKESKGVSVKISDEEMLQYGKEIARTEGIFVEPASAATVACLPKLIDAGVIDSSDKVVSLITSSGLKTNDILKTLHKRRKSIGLSARLATKERLLKEISETETYGYALWKGMEKELTLGAVYQHISDLENKGLISSKTAGKRRYLKITKKGRRVLSSLDELKVLL
jgi:threonine synthase